MVERGLYRIRVSSRVLGVDACRAGWVGVVLHDGVVTVHVAGTVAALVADVEVAGQLAVIGVDIPIGLPDAGRRQADILAYKLVGPRRSSVFMTPVRAALEADSHAAAVAANRERAGEGVSAQVYGLRSKIFEVDVWARHAGRRVVEVHPEVSFATLAGSPLPDGKRTWAGACRRWRLLAGAGVHLADDVGEAGRHAAVDDVLDAGAAAWTAERVATGTATPLPNPPVEYSDGWPAAIWV
jgi:predicted RNase H-like nuclease